MREIMSGVRSTTSMFVNVFWSVFFIFCLKKNVLIWLKGLNCFDVLSYTRVLVADTRPFSLNLLFTSLSKNTSQ
jgi:hypothetical protein